MIGGRPNNNRPFGKKKGGPAAAASRTWLEAAIAAKAAAADVALAFADCARCRKGGRAFSTAPDDEEGLEMAGGVNPMQVSVCVRAGE